MATYVLIHGGWSANWVWSKNVKALEDAGHKVVCLELPGHGENHPEKLGSVGLADHVAYLEAEISKLDGSVILCGHSMAGMIISQIAEDMPQKVEKLVYIAAFLPSEDGQCMMPMITDDPWTTVSPKTTINLDNGLCTFVPKYGRNMAFNTSSDEVFKFAMSHMKLENPKMWSDPVHLTQNYHDVPKYYIHTLKDNCCTYYQQRVMIKAEPIVKEYNIDSDHFVMSSAPDEFNAAMLDIAKHTPDIIPGSNFS